MSGIYIHNMKLPKSCEECPCSYWTEGAHHDYCQALGYDSEIKYGSERKLDNCPLVPVPPHGRLIDADALDDILADQSEDAYNRTHAPRSWERALSAMRDYLDDAPTIIPAEGERT